MEYDKAEKTCDKYSYNNHEPNRANKDSLCVSISLVVVFDGLCDIDRANCWHIFERIR